MTDRETQTNLENDETVSLLTSNIFDLKKSTTKQLLLSHAFEKNHTQCDRLIEIDKTKKIVNKILVSTFVLNDNLECFSNKLVRISMWNYSNYYIIFLYDSYLHICRAYLINLCYQYLSLYNIHDFFRYI